MLGVSRARVKDGSGPPGRGVTRWLPWVEGRVLHTALPRDPSGPAHLPLSSSRLGTEPSPTLPRASVPLASASGHKWVIVSPTQSARLAFWRQEPGQL